MRDYLQKHVKPGGPKTLEQSIIAMPIKVGNGTLTVGIQGEDYWNFVNKGVGGAGNNERIDGRKTKKTWKNKAPNSPFKFKDKPPPINYSSVNGESLFQWSKRHGANPFVVQEAIFRGGLKPIPFVDDTITAQFKEAFAQKLGEIIGRVIEVDIKTDFDGK